VRPRRKQNVGKTFSGPSIQFINNVAFPKPNTRDQNILKLYELGAHLTLFRYAPKLVLDPTWRWKSALDVHNPQPYMGEGRYEHARAIDAIVWPTEFEYHKYSEEHTQAFCEDSAVAVSGGGGTSKSTSVAAYALKFHWCAPACTAVLIASTTIEAAERRVWKEILRLYYAAHRKLQNVFGTVPIRKPKPMIQMRDKEGNVDIAHGLFIIAVAKGEIEKGINSIKGFHEPRMLYIGDETDSIQQAVVDAKQNLRIGCEEFQEIWLGNDPSLLNPLGQLMQPERGKPVTLAHKKWRSAEGLLCIRSSGYDSPNIPVKKYRGIVTQEDINSITKNGERRNSAMAWVMIEGLHPPEGCDDTVLSESTLFKFNCFESVTWQRSYIESASLDPAFGGDPCVLRFFRRGLDTKGTMRILMTERIEIPIEADQANNPAEYQIAAKTKEQCKSRSIPPEEFVIGMTGIGRGTAAVLQREWSPRINVCDESGACSDMIVSEEDPRPSKEKYDRRVTELYMSIREFVEADMIRGMDTQYTALQLCARKVEPKGKLQSLEKKRDMKDRGQPSPNDSDALAFYIDMLRTKGINASVQTQVKKDYRKELAQDFNSYEPAEDEMYPDPVYDQDELEEAY
jgi:hypothetical protein